jgi:hypothetical protein
MAVVRNISRDVRKVAHVGKTVGLDELLEVADVDFLDRVWPTSTWQLTTPPAGGVDASTADAILYKTDDGQSPAAAAPPAAVDPPPAADPPDADHDDDVDGQV